MVMRAPRIGETFIVLHKSGNAHDRQGSIKDFCFGGEDVESDSWMGLQPQAAVV